MPSPSQNTSKSNARAWALASAAKPRSRAHGASPVLRPPRGTGPHPPACARGAVGLHAVAVYDVLLSPEEVRITTGGSLVRSSPLMHPRTSSPSAFGSAQGLVVSPAAQRGGPAPRSGPWRTGSLGLGPLAG